MKAIGEYILLDSSVWLSYFLAENDLSKEFIEGGNHLLMTSVLSIFEIKRKMLMKNVKEPKIEEFLKFIKTRSLLLEIDEKICNSAVEPSIKHKLHTIDSLIYCSSLLNNATLITGDRHFENLENVFLLE